MKKIHTFFQTLLKSCTSPAYYADVLRASSWFSLKFLLVVQLFFSLTTTVIITAAIARFDLVGTLGEVKTWYPNDLAIEFENGELSINQPLPYKIPIQADIAAEFGDVRYLAVFEKEEAISGVADALDQDAFVVLTEKSAYVRDENGLRAYPFPADSAESFSFDVSQVDAIFDMIVSHPFIAQKWYVVGIAAVMFAFVYPFSVLMALWTAVVYGGVVWLVSRMLAGPVLGSRLLKFGEVYRVSIHSIVPLLIVQRVLELLGQGMMFEGLSFFAVFLIWTMFVLSVAVKKDAKPEPVVKKIADTTPTSKKKSTSRTKAG